MPDLSGVDLGRVAFRPSVRADDAGWQALTDMILRVALSDPAVEGQSVGAILSAGQIQRIRSFAPTPTAVFDRTLGEQGGQGFVSTSPPGPS